MPDQPSFTQPLVATAPPPAPPARGAWPWRDRALLALVIACLIGVTAIFPLYQGVLTGGYLFYENGSDEASYLQYEFSRAVQSVTRPGQYGVSLMHEWGLSGGWINAVWDLGMWLALPVLLHAIWRRVGWTQRQATLGALLVLVLPHAVLHTNPLIKALSDWNGRSGALYWLNMPDVDLSPFMRTPEPQFSLLFLAVGLLLALRWRVHWPVYATLPFMYPFVSIPVGFVALACHLRARWPFARGAAAGPLVAAFLALSAGCWAYYAWLVTGKTRLLVTPSSLPLISFTALVALGLFVALRAHIEVRHRFFALAVALAPLAASNQQLLSGHIPQPSNFERCVGVIAVAIVVTLALKAHARWGLAAGVAGGALFVLSAYHTFRLDQAYMLRLPMTPALVDALKTDSAHVAVKDPFVASRLGMVHPRQAMTALAFERTYVNMADRYIGEYRCIKRQLAAEHPGVYEGAFGLLDEAYEYGSQKFVMAHIYRKSTFVKLHDAGAAGCRDATHRPLRHFPLVW
jgi:hypothetical protein